MKGQNNMTITCIQIRKTINDGPIRAVASIVIDDALAIHDIKIIQTDKLFIGMPNRVDKNGVCRDIVHPINAEARHYVESQVLAAYIEFIETNDATADNSANDKAVCSESSDTSQITKPATKKHEPQRINYLCVNENRFKIAHVIPSGYTIWNIGTKMSSGFLPICRLKQQQPFDGAREIIEESLIAIPLPEAQLILNLVSQGINTMSKMQSYVKKFESRAKSEAVKTRIAQCKTAIEILQKIPGAKDLTE